MNKYSLKLENKIDALFPKSLLALRGVKIGPIFPAIDESWQVGMRGVPLPKDQKENKTKWAKHREKRRVRRHMAQASRRRNGT